MTIGGHDVAESPLEAKRLIGYLPENAAAYPDMTVQGFLGFAAELRGLHGDARKQRGGARGRSSASSQSVLHQSIDTLSKGYRHRTCLAQALIHDPEVLILDEPTDGLDPNQKHEVRNLIRELGRNKAIIFSTHILEEVDAACTRAIIIDRGRIVANGTPEELRAMSDLHGAVTLAARGGERREARGAGARGAAEWGVPDLSDRDKQRPGAGAGGHRPREPRRLEGRGMYNEAGQLDEVFRRITLPDTVKR